MFSVLTKGVGSWTGEVALQDGSNTSSSSRECRSAVVDLTRRDSDVSSLPLNLHSGVHRHGITVSSHSLVSSTTATSSDHGELILPRTFTTRKGALMLFADDTQVDYARCRHLLNSAKRAQTLLFQDELEKLGSLARLSSSVLTFGDQDYDSETCSISNPENKVFLKFLKSLGEVEVDLNVQPGGNAIDYLRNLRHRLIRTKLRSGGGRTPLSEEGQGRLVQSMSSISQLRSPDHLSRRDSQMHVPDRLMSEFRKEQESQKLDFSSEFSIAMQPSETVVPLNCYSATTLPGIYDETFRTVNQLHGLIDKSESQTLNPISSVLLTNLSRNASRSQSQNDSNFRSSAEQTTDEQEALQTSDASGDEESEALNLAYGMLHDYESGDYYETDERRSPEVTRQGDDDGIDLVQPLMPAYDPTYDDLPSISKSFSIEIPRIDPLRPTPAALSVGAKPRSATPASASGRSSSTGFPPKNRPVTARTHRPTSTTITTAREVKSAGHSVQRAPLSVNHNSRTGSSKVTTDHLIRQASTFDKKSKDQVAETNVARVGEDKRLSKTLRITRMRTPSDREKKQNVPSYTIDLPDEKTTNQTSAEADDGNISRVEEDSADLAKVEVIETKVAENTASSEEVKAVPMSARRKSKRTKGARMIGEDNGLLKKLDADKVALREARRKEADLKKLFAEERLAEEKRLAEERKLRLAEEEQLAEKRERDKEDFAALAEKEAILQEQIAEARRKAEEAREVEDAARNALAATWKMAREHREEQRKAHIERRKQELIERNRKEQECISNAKRKEQEMLERIGSADELRRFREAERLRKEETAHAQMLRLEEAEHLARIAYEKEEERYLDMEREAEEAAMAKLVQERLEADQRPERLKDKQRKLRSEGSMKKSAFLAEERDREERLKKLQEEEERMEEEARHRLLEMQKLQEEAAQRAQQVRDARSSAVLQRRELNIKNRRHLESLRHDQTNLNQPWTFSYYVHWPRETYAKLGSQDPRKKSGFRSPIKHTAKK